MMRTPRVAWFLLAASLLGSAAWSEIAVFNPSFDTDVSGWTPEPSVEFVALPSKIEAEGSRVVLYDDLLFQAAALFADEFESGDLTAWSYTTQPILTAPPYVDITQIAGLWWPYCDSGDCPWQPPTQLHDGLDFTPNGDLVAFQASAPGEVIDVDAFLNPGNGFYQVNVMVSCSPDDRHGLIYAFEPMTPDRADRDLQLANIDVQVGQVVAPGDVIGRLVQGQTYAHLHFGIWENWQQTCPERFLSYPVKTELLNLIQRDNPTWEICN